LRIVLPHPSREDGVAQLADQLGRVGQGHVMHLDVLAGGDVALAERDVLLDHLGERVELVGRDPAHRQLHPDHLHGRLSLAVDALLQAKLDELVLLQGALEEAGGLGIEVVELPLENRDDVPGHVLEDLGILERSGAGAWGLGAFEGCRLLRDPSGGVREQPNVPKPNRGSGFLARAHAREATCDLQRPNPWATSDPRPRARGPLRGPP
jgi:hypothetical protein